MDLLKQCQQWFEQNEIQKVIDALEAIPAPRSAPRSWTASLAKAYIGVAAIGESGRALYEKALELLRLPMRSILPKITAGIIGSLPPTTFWTRKAPPCVTLKRP